MHICICVCVFMCRGQQSKLGFFLDCSLPCFLRQDLSQNLEFACSARLTGQSTPQVLLFMPPQYCDYRCFAVPSCSSSSSSSSSKKKNQSQVFIFALKTLYEFNPLPSPRPPLLVLLCWLWGWSGVSRESIHIPAVAFMKMLSFYCCSLHTGLTWSLVLKSSPP